MTKAEIKQIILEEIYSALKELNHKNPKIAPINAAINTGISKILL